MCTILDEGHGAFNDAELFPSTNKLLNELTDEEGETIPFRQTRSDARANPGNLHTIYHGYLLTGAVEDAINKVINELKEVLNRLKESITQRYVSIVNDDFFKASAQFLDTPSYQDTTIDVLFDCVNVIVERYAEQFKANGCDLQKIKAEFRVLYNHVTKFLSKSCASRTWPQIFRLKNGLGLHNILHIAELCIVIPLSNAECERIFSFL